MPFLTNGTELLTLPRSHIDGPETDVECLTWKASVKSYLGKITGMLGVTLMGGLAEISRCHRLHCSFFIAVCFMQAMSHVCSVPGATRGRRLLSHLMEFNINVNKCWRWPKKRCLQRVCRC